LGIGYITDVVQKLVLRYGERDPKKLADAMNIRVLYESMGEYSEACKGFFMVQSRIKVIVINRDLPEVVQRIILAHELGHAVLHTKTLAMQAYHDFSLYQAADRAEYEANLFAADLLLEDEQVIGKLREASFFFDAAKELLVPPELLDFKFRILKEKKLLTLDSPIIGSSTFLKKS